MSSQVLYRIDQAICDGPNVNIVAAKVSIISTRNQDTQGGAWRHRIYGRVEEQRYLVNH
jgi:hypothetical protein